MKPAPRPWPNLNLLWFTDPGSPEIGVLITWIGFPEIKTNPIIFFNEAWRRVIAGNMRVRAGLGERRTLSLDSRWMAACRHRELKLPVTRPTRPTPGFNFLSHIFGIVQWYPKKLFQKNESHTRLQLQLAMEAVTVICTSNSGLIEGCFLARRGLCRQPPY